MNAIFKTKNNYGKESIYPVNDTAVMLTKLTRKLTVDNNDLELIRQLGYIVYIDNQPVIFDLETIFNN